MTEALFVSDIHISSPKDEKYVLFLQLLDRCRMLQIKHLFLVGDIFDLWIADRSFFVESYADAIAKIQNLVNAGTTVHYFEGNHDLDLQVFWRDRLGVKVYLGAEYFSLSGLNVRVEHGDQMDPHDRGYLFLRWLLRTNPMRMAGRRLPNGLVKRVGEKASSTSRDYTSHVKVADEVTSKQKIHTHARSVFLQKPFDVFISGHVHVIEDSSIDMGGKSVRVLNLGTWLKKPMCLEISDQGDVVLHSVQQFVEAIS